MTTETELSFGKDGGPNEFEEYILMLGDESLVHEFLKKAKIMPKISQKIEAPKVLTDEDGDRFNQLKKRQENGLKTYHASKWLNCSGCEHQYHVGCICYNKKTFKKWELYDNKQKCPQFYDGIIRELLE